MQEQQDTQRMHEGGFTLIELLIAIVVVGILTAVAIVGIGGLVNNGANSACSASADAAKAAAAVHKANFNVYPASFAAMTSGSTPELDISAGVTPSGATQLVHGTDWTLTMNSGGTSSINFTC